MMTKTNNKPTGNAWKNDKGTISMNRCFKCGKENYAHAVTSGQCAWCGYEATEADVVKIDYHKKRNTSTQPT